MTGPLFSPAPGEGNGRRASSSRHATRAEDPRTAVNRAVRSIIVAAPSELGERLESFQKLCQGLFSNSKLAPLFSKACAAVLDGGKESKPERAQAFIELCLGVSTSSLGERALKYGMRHIAGIYGEGAAHAKRLTTMAEAVAEAKGDTETTKRSRIMNLPRLFAAFDPSSGVYSGTSYALENLCKKFGIMDPFQAVARAKTNWPLRSELPGGLSGEKVKADSTGGMMTSSSVYRVVNTRDSETPPFICGIDALTSIMGAFHGDRLARGEWRNTPALKEQRAREIGDEIKSKALSQLLEAPLVEDAAALLEDTDRSSKSTPQDDAENSHSIRRKQAILDALNAEIKAALEDRETLSAARRGLLPALRRPTYQLENQTTGVWMNWFSKEIERNPLQVPEHVVVAFRELSDPHSGLSVKERSYYTRALVLYQAKRSPISRDLALADIRSDADWYGKFADSNPDHPLVTTFGPPAGLIQPVQELLRSAQRDMSLAELRAAEVPLTGIMRLRSHQNRTTYERHHTELEETLATLEPLFLESASAKENETERAWREDSRGETVPMERLRETVAGLALSRDDFFYVREMARFRDFALNINPKLKDGTLGQFSEMPIADFEAMVHGCVIAGRKIAHLCNLLESHKTGASASNLCEAYDDSLAHLKEKTLRGGKYQLLEASIETGHQAAVGAFKRAQAYHVATSSDVGLSKAFSSLNHEGPEVGLCHADDVKAVAKIILLAEKPTIRDAVLFPRADLIDFDSAIQRHSGNPLLIPSYYAHPSKAWYTRHEFETRKNLASAMEQAAAKVATGSMSDDKLRELLSRYSTTAVFLQGGLRLAPKVQFQVKARPLAEVCRSSPDRKEVIRWQNEEPVIDAAVSGDVKVKHYHRDRLEALLQSIESSTGGTLQNNSPWVAWSALPDWWKAAARKIATAESLRNMQGKAPDGIDGSQFPADLRSLVNSDSDTWGIFNRDSDFSLGTRRFSLSRPLAKSPERLFVSREIANVITSLAARFKLPLED